VFAGWGFAPEAHYIVHDPTGKSIVIEYVDGSSISMTTLSA
jgi:choloylglycine hydrolase